MKWHDKIRKKMTLKEEFLRHFRSATILFMMMGFCDAAVSFTVFKYNRLFFFEHEGGLLARITIDSYINMNPLIFYTSIAGHLLIYFGTIIFGLYIIRAFKKESDEKINAMSRQSKWTFVMLLFTLYFAGFLHYFGVASWLVN